MLPRRDVGDEAFGGEHERSDRGGALQCGAGDGSGVDDPGGGEVLEDAGGGAAGEGLVGEVDGGRRRRVRPGKKQVLRLIDTDNFFTDFCY